MIVTSRKLYFLVTLLFAVSACDSIGDGFGVAPPVADQVTLCSAGYGISITADLRAQLEDVSAGGSVSADVEQTLKGQIFAGADISEENTLKAYQSYLDCVRGERKKSEFVSILKLRRDTILSYLSGRGFTDDDLESLTDLMERHISATEQGQLGLAHDLHTQINVEITRLNSIQVAGASTGVLFYEL